MESTEQERSNRHRVASTGGSVVEKAQKLPHRSQQGKSSPTSASSSSDSFSSYLNKEALAAHQRSSSPRPFPDSQELPQLEVHQTPAMASPRDRFSSRFMESETRASPHSGLTALEFSSPARFDTHFHPLRERFEFSHSRNGHSLDTVDVRQLQGHRSLSLPMQSTPSRPSHRNIAVLDNHDDRSQQSIQSYPDLPPTLPKTEIKAESWADDHYAHSHGGSQEGDQFDDANESVSSKANSSKGDIRRRRRTRPDEANVLAAAYAENAFPDQDTRHQLAEKLGMTVRAVSVWFQNRRQAEKKRSGRYGGSGIVSSGLVSSQPPEQTTPLSSSKTENGHKHTASPAVTPLGASNRNRNDLNVAVKNASIPLDLTNSNKENIPPWVTAGGIDGQLKNLGRQKQADGTSSTPVRSLSRSSSRDLRDLLKPSGPGLSTAPMASPAPTSTGLSGKTKITRQVSAPRLSLEEVIQKRSSTFQRSVTATGVIDRDTARADLEDEDMSTILPPRRVLSRASSLSLLTTAGGRASIGNLSQASQSQSQSQSPSPSPPKAVSLNSRLPAHITAALQRQGIIGNGQDEEEARREEESKIWQRMQSSSAGSSEADARGDADERRESEEDEERTLRLVAHRRAAKARAQADGGASSADADARKAIHKQRPSLVGLGTPSATPSAATAAATATVGLRRTPSLDWAAGRDRAVTSALPQRVTSTPSLSLVGRREPLGEKRLCNSNARVVTPSPPKRRRTDVLQQSARKHNYALSSERGPGHDDSGFFGSDDENVAPKPTSPRKKRELDHDRQAAELLLGLGMGRGSAR